MTAPARPEASSANNTRAFSLKCRYGQKAGVADTPYCQRPRNRDWKGKQAPPQTQAARGRRGSCWICPPRPGLQVEGAPPDRLADQANSHPRQEQGSRRSDDLRGQWGVEKLHHSEHEPEQEQGFQRGVPYHHPRAEQPAAAAGLDCAGDGVREHGTGHQGAAQGHDKGEGENDPEAGECHGACASVAAAAICGVTFERESTLNLKEPRSAVSPGIMEMTASMTDAGHVDLPGQERAVVVLNCRNPAERLFYPAGKIVSHGRAPAGGAENPCKCPAGLGRGPFEDHEVVAGQDCAHSPGGGRPRAARSTASGLRGGMPPSTLRSA